MESIYVKCITAIDNRLDIDFEVTDGIKKYFDDKLHFFAQYTTDISDVPKSILVIPILTNILQLSWLTDSVIWVEEIDEDFYNIIPKLKNAFRELHPKIEMRGTLIAAKLINNSFIPKKEAMQLFTGGVDATATFIRIYDKKPILFNTNGWYKQNPFEENSVYDADFQAINQIAQSNSVTAEFVKSNFATFIRGAVVNTDFKKITNSTWWFGFQHSLAFIGCAMVLGYRYKIKNLYIASSYTFGQYVVCVSDPRIDSCIECAGIKTIHDGYELSRQDKVRLIIEYQRKTNMNINLRVCSFNTHNCCNCEKCFRSMLALVADGAEDLGKFGFDLDDTLLNKLKNFINNNAMELDHDHIVFWNDIILKMKNNYNNIKYKEIYDFLKNVDLEKAKKKAVWNHYRKDYRDIIKRRIFKK